MAKEFESTFRVNYSAILDELLMQCQPGAIIRTMTLYVRDVEVPGYDGDERPFMKLLNTHILEVASEHNIPVARVDVAFSGLSRDEDPVAKGFSIKRGIFPRYQAQSKSPRYTATWAMSRCSIDVRSYLYLCFYFYYLILISGSI